MNIETIMSQIEVYGYFILFLFLFFGIVGIPAPEESLLILIGLFISQEKLSFFPAFFSAFFGAFTGMLFAYACGKYVGSPFMNKYGKYIGVTPERLAKVQNQYRSNARKTIIMGLYLPGIRQISPYFAGISGIRFLDYVICSGFGIIVWIVPFIVAGYYAGSFFNVNPMYVSYLGVVFLLLFFLYILIKHLFRKREKSVG